MLKDEMHRALCDQINAETYSSYLYVSMAAYFEARSLKGFAHWMRIQAQEEILHAMKLFDFVCERGGRVDLGAIAGPSTEWASPLAVFEQALAHERTISERIDKLADLAISLSDHATGNMLQWFVAEQVEEEANADEIVQQLRILAGDGHGLLMLDRELGARPAAITVVAPAGPTAA
jgi:ferritin